MCLQACSPTSGNVQIAVTFGGSSCGGITTNSQYPGQHNVKTLSWSLIDADLGVPRAGGNGISCVVGAGYTVSGLDFGYYALTVSAQNLLGTTCWDNRGTPVATLTSGGFYSCDGTTNCQTSSASNCNCPFHHDRNPTQVNFDVAAINSSCAQSGS